MLYPFNTNINILILYSVKIIIIAITCILYYLSVILNFLKAILL